jgi:hypothetical protein
MGCLALIVASLVGSTTPMLASDSASHNQWSHCNAFPGKYADERITNLFYRGMYGWFFTYQPNVPFPSFQFSLSHLYPHTNNGDTVMEVGWYKGQGRTIPSTTVTRYYTVHADFGPSDYVEENWGIVPDATWKEYEAQYEWFNFSTNRYVWGLYGGDLVNALAHYESQFLSNGLPLSGGEVDEVGVQMQVRLTPNHSLKKPDGLWYSWTEAFMASEGGSVATCNDLGLSWTYFRKFDDYQVTGTAQ